MRNVLFTHKSILILSFLSHNEHQIDSQHTKEEIHTPLHYRRETEKRLEHVVIGREAKIEFDLDDCGCVFRLNKMMIISL